jgi:protein-S-isoprenylcysteine O-methyltransferase Ste14
VSERKFWMRWRVRAGYLVGVLFWLLAKPTPQSIVYGAILAAFGLLVRGIASGHLRKDRELAVTGPYACTRNPLYLGSALLAAGFIVAGHSWIAGVLVAVYFGIFYYAVMRNEEEDLRSRFGAAFAEYASRVPLFFPRAPKEPVACADSASESNGKFSMAQCLQNHEYKASIGTGIGLAIMWLRMWLRARTGY